MVYSMVEERHELGGIFMQLFNNLPIWRFLIFLVFLALADTWPNV